MRDEDLRELELLREAVGAFFVVTGVGRAGADWENAFRLVRRDDEQAKAFLDELRKLLYFIEGLYAETRDRELLGNPRAVPPPKPVAPAKAPVVSKPPVASRPVAPSRPAVPAKPAAPSMPAAPARPAALPTPAAAPKAPLASTTIPPVPRDDIDEVFDSFDLGSYSGAEVPAGAEPSPGGELGDATHADFMSLTAPALRATPATGVPALRPREARPPVRTPVPAPAVPPAVADHDLYESEDDEDDFVGPQAPHATDQEKTVIRKLSDIELADARRPSVVGPLRVPATVRKFIDDTATRIGPAPTREELDGPDGPDTQPVKAEPARPAAPAPSRPASKVAGRTLTPFQPIARWTPSMAVPTPATKPDAEAKPGTEAKEPPKPAAPDRKPPKP